MRKIGMRWRMFPTGLGTNIGTSRYFSVADMTAEFSCSHRCRMGPCSTVMTADLEKKSRLKVAVAIKQTKHYSHNPSSGPLVCTYLLQVLNDCRSWPDVHVRSVYEGNMYSRYVPPTNRALGNSIVWVLSSRNPRRCRLVVQGGLREGF